MTGHDRSGGRSDDDAALQALSVAYAAAADARDGVALADLFGEEGELVVPRYPTDLAPVITRSGRDALRQVAEMLRRYSRTFHLVSHGRFVVEGDEASGEVQCVAHHVTAAAPPEPAGAEDTVPAGTDTVWFIRYHDRYRRAGPGWRFVRRELHLQWVEEHPVTVLGAPPGGPS